MSQPTPATDPFDLLLNAGSDPGLWLLLAGPAALLVLIIVIYAVLVSRRRRQEARELKANVEESEDARIVPFDGRTAAGPEDIDDVTPFPVPPDLESVPLTPEESGRKKPLALVRPEAAVGPAEVEEVRRLSGASWRERLTQGLTKTRDSLRSGLKGIFGGRVKLDADVLERLHEMLYRADIGVRTADTLVTHVRETLPRDESQSWEAVSGALKDKARSILMRSQQELVNKPATGPWVILIVGVNGVGKTTTIGKLAAHFLADNKKVLLAAGDTFRAAAIEQLAVWGDRLGVEVIKHQQGGDPAAVAYDAVKAARARGVDVLLIDTAGRLHAKTELMAELGKINRAIAKDLPGAPHETWLVIDATTGQNAVQQVKAFSEVVSVSGLVVTKLDGTAKGGVLIGIADQYGLPIRYVGVGEKAADLRAFNAGEYVDLMF